jgi:Transcriptional regulator/sugar kinase
VRSTTGEVLTLLRDRGPTSRAELARTIGVSAAALSKITAHLISTGQVMEEEAAPSASQLGRPPVNISLVNDGHFLVGAHFGAGRVGLIITDAVLAARATKRFDFNPKTTSAEALIERAGREINQLIDSCGVYRRKVRGVGISVPGAVDRDGRFNVYSSFADWHEVPFADRIEEIVGLPAVVEHNATAIALSEARFGAGRDMDTILYVYMRSGIGAGLAHSAAVARAPAHRGPVEMGHIVLDPAGPACRCGGRGCLETVFSEAPLLAGLGLDAVPAGGLIAAAMEDARVWAPAYERFVQALATTVTLMSPDLVILGGHLGEAPERLFSDLRRDLPPRVMPQQRAKLRVERTSLGPDASAKGAACVGLEKFVYAEGGR